MSFFVKYSVPLIKTYKLRSLVSSGGRVLDLQSGSPGSIPPYCCSLSGSVFLAPIDSIIDITNISVVLLRHC